MSRLFIALLALQLSLGFLRVGAAEMQVILDNGDRISGELLFEDDTEVRLLVDYLGTITVPRDRVLNLEMDMDPILESEDLSETEEPGLDLAKLNETEVEVTEENMEDGESRALDEGSADSEQIAENAVDADESASEEELENEEKEEVSKRIIVGVLATLAELEEGFNPLPKWTKRLQFGFNSNSGRKDQSNLNYRLEMSRKIEQNRLNFNADYAYGEANDATTLDKLSTRFRWRKDFGPGVYYESQSDYSSDSIKRIDSNIEQKFGLGTRFIDNKVTTLSAGLGASGRWRQIADEEREVDYLLNLSQDWDYKMTERIAVKQDFTFAMPLEESDEYEINFAAALTSEVTKSINLSLRYQLGFDNSLPPETREDRRIISSLGYSF